MALDPQLHAMPINIIIADDHELTRVGIQRILASEPQIIIVGEASNGDEVLRLVRQHPVDIVLLDVLMPRRNGLEVARELKSRNPVGKPYIIFLTSYDDQDYLEQALAIGVDGYLSKNLTRKELHEAIHTVMRGERVFSHTILDIMRGISNHLTCSNSTSVTLTKREEEILNLVASGLTSSEIAKKLFISPRTVETHRAHLMEKLGVRNTAALVRFALLHSNIFRIEDSLSKKSV